MLLGALGLGASLFVIFRLFEAWHVAPRSGANQVSILGVTLAYPAANADAIVILALAVIGFVVIGIAVLAAAQEIAGAIRLGRRLKAARPVQRGRALTAASVLTLIAAVAALAGKIAAGSATLTLPFVSRQTCIVVLAMIPAAIALLVGYLAMVHRARTK